MASKASDNQYHGRVLDIANLVAQKRFEVWNTHLDPGVGGMGESVFTLLDSDIRRRILEALARRSMSFTELMQSLEITNTGRLCHHLRALRGYVSQTDVGYTVTPSGLSLLRAARMLSMAAKDPGESPKGGMSVKPSQSPAIGRMRKVARCVCDELLGERDDILSVCVTEDVAWGDVTLRSPINLGVFLDSRKNPDLSDYAPQSREKDGLNIDISYITFKEVVMELDIYYGSDWEVASSMMEDCLVLYDPTGRLARIKRENKGYPMEMRRRNARYLNEKRLEADEAMWRCCLSRDLEMQKVFAAACAIQSLRLVFPVCGKKLRSEARLMQDARRLVGSAELKDDWEHLILPSQQAEIKNRDEICRRLVGIGQRIAELAENNGMIDALNHPSELHLDFIS